MRSLWQGAISFGLINIPVKLYSASRARELQFKLLHKKDHAPIRYARMCEKEGKEVSWNEIVKGYEFKKDEFIVLTEEDFKNASPKKTGTIEIVGFTEEAEIDSIYFDKPYYLEPEKGAEKAYALLVQALRQSQKVAVAHFAFRHHEHLDIIRPYENVLLLNQLRYTSEIVSHADLKIPKKILRPKEVEFALQLIEQLTIPFEPEKYKDTYTSELKALIRKKSKGKKVSIPKAEQGQTAQIYDIMELLKNSLEKQKKAPKRRAA